MKRAPIVEDWSRFNRAVMAVADGRLAPIGRRPPAAPPKRQPPQIAPQIKPEIDPDFAPDFVPEPAGEPGDIYGIIARNKWRTNA